MPSWPQSWTGLRVVERPRWSPGTLVVLFATAQVVVWTLAPALTHSAPPIDVVEGYMWGREWVIATFKHPALPSWFLEASRLLTGAIGLPAYLLSQLFVAATFALVFLLGRDMMGAARAAAGTLLLAGVAYYSWPTLEFNHNVASLPFWAGLALALWRAVERRSSSWWMLVGAIGAGALYAKLSAALLLVPAAAWVAFDQRARLRLSSPGPWIGLAVFVILSTPLALWLIAHDFAPLQHAALRLVAGPATRLHVFLLDTAANLGGMLVMLLLAGLVKPRRWMTKRGPPEPNLSWPDRRRIVTFLLFLTLGPLVLAVAGAALSHAGLKTAWGSSMFNLAGLLAIALTTGRFSHAALRRLAFVAAVIVLVVPIGYATAVKVDAHQPLRGGMRVNWPQRAIAERLGSVWATQTGQPLRIVAGEPWLAGLVGLTNPAVPSILTQGDVSLSPWITSARIDREGMLIVWDAGAKQPPPKLASFLKTSRQGIEKFVFERGKISNEFVIGYAIVPPWQPDAD